MKKVLYVEEVTATPKDFEVILPPNSNLKYIVMRMKKVRFRDQNNIYTIINKYLIEYN